MSRFWAVFVVIPLLAPFPWTAACADESPTAELAKRAREVRKKLAAPMEFNGFEDPALQLKEALQFLHMKADLNF